MNESEAGKKAQVSLKKKLENGLKNLRAKEKSIQEEEKKIIQQKKIISAEEYKKKVENLRSKSKFIEERKKHSFGDCCKTKNESKKRIIKKS